MGKIIALRTASDNKVNITLELSESEAKLLQGNLNKIHVFSEDNLTSMSKLVQRGKRESTKYFLLPKDSRKGITPSSFVPCMRLETKTRNIFIYSVKKY